MKARLTEEKGKRHDELDSFAISKAMHHPVRQRRRKRLSFSFMTAGA